MRHARIRYGHPLGAVFAILLALICPPWALARIDNIASIDHMEFFVTDLSGSLRFYTRLFGADLYKNKQSERRYLPLGVDYIAFEQRDIPKVDHVCIGIHDFDIGVLHDLLQDQGISWQDYPSGRDLRVEDADGIRTQLAADNSWPQISTATAAPQTYEPVGPAVFSAREILEVGLRVTDLARARTWYADILGEPEEHDGFLLFTAGASRIRLMQASATGAVGISDFVVLVNPTDMTRAMNAVKDAGGRIESNDENGFAFLDPDGLGVVIRTSGRN